MPGSLAGSRRWLERLIADALKTQPVSQTKEQFTDDAVVRYVDNLRKSGYHVR